MYSSKPLAFSEIPPTEYGEYGRDDDCNEESPSTLFHAVDEVHAKEACHEGWQHDDHVEAREQTHHLVHVVVDEVGIGIHGGVEDVGVYGSHFACLLHLDVHVFDEFGIEVVDRQSELKFREQSLVATNRCSEVCEAVLQARKACEVLVVDISVEVALGLLDEPVDLFQILQIPHTGAEEEAEYEVGGIDEPFGTSLLMVDKVNHHLCLLMTDGDNFVVLDKYAERDGGIWGSTCDVFDVRDAEDDHEPPFVVIVTSTLVGIADVFNEIIRNAQFVDKVFHVVLNGASHLHPATRLPLVEMLDALIKIPISTHKFTLFALIHKSVVSTKNKTL